MRICIPDQIVKQNRIPELKLIADRIRRIFSQYVKHPLEIARCLPLILFRCRQSHRLAEILLMEPVWARQCSDHPAVLINEPVIPPGRKENLLLLSMPRVQDPAPRNGQSAFPRCHHRQPFIDHDRFQPDMALFHYVGTGSRSMGQVPFIMVPVIIKPGLPGSAGKGKMRLDHHLCRFYNAFRGKLPDLRFCHPLIGSGYLLAFFLHAYRAQAFLSQSMQDGQVIILIRMHPLRHAPPCKSLRQESFKKGCCLFCGKCILLQRQAD